MTYIVGWKFRGNIYLTSDSAITRYVQTSNTNETSVGETSISTPGLSINEESYKLFQIDNDCIIAISGDVNNALELVHNIRTYSSVTDRESLLDRFCNSARGNQFDAVIALIVNNTPKLYLFRSEETEYLQEKENFVCRGSGVSVLALRTQQLIDSIRNQKMTPTERLAFLVSGHQLFSIGEDIFASGVGGIFNGVRISKLGIQWNEDVSYIFYSNNTMINETTNEINGDSSFIFAFNRDLMFYVKSPHPSPTGTDKLLPNCEQVNLTPTSTEVRQWNTTHYQELNNQIYRRRKKSKYLSLIYKSNQDKYKVSIVKFNSSTFEKIHVEYDGTGWYSLYAQIGTLRQLMINEGDNDVECVIIRE